MTPQSATTRARAAAGALVQRLPGPAVAQIDFRLRPSARRGWGGALNGQTHRRKMARGVIDAIDAQMIIETGTFRGASTEFFTQFGVPVYSVEKMPRFFHYARLRLRADEDVHLQLGDSRAFLESVPACSAPVFIYLDAHWGSDLPLATELETIARRFPAAVVMIDDFAVPGDPGYGYDDYGPGKIIAESLLRSVSAIDAWARLYPSVTSAAESGRKRGSVVLASPATVDRVRGLSSLRELESVG